MRDQEQTVSSSPSGEHHQFVCSALSGLIAFSVLFFFVRFAYSFPLLRRTGLKHKRSWPFLATGAGGKR